MAEVKEVEEEVLRIWLEVAKDDVVIWRLIEVADVLKLNKDELVRYLPKFLSVTLLQNSKRHEDVKLAIESAIIKIANTLGDYETWDSYSASRAPSAYKYAAAVVSWLYLLATSYGSYIPLSCPLFDRRVVAAITEFLATMVAYPVHEALREALVDAKEKLIRLSPPIREILSKMSRERLEEEVLLRFCSPP
jgi:hypothetical protein